MTIPAGQAAFSDINTELARTSTAQLNLNDDEVRDLAAKFTGQISVNDLRGKSAFGSAWSWGGAYGYSLAGDGLSIVRSSPVQLIGSTTTWRCIFSHQFDTRGAIKTDGTLWMWGANGQTNLGRIGNNTSFGGVSSPVQTIAGGTNWKEVRGGMYHVLALKRDGTLWVWGGNYGGALGTNDSTSNHRSSPVQTVTGGTNWKAIGAGRNMSGGVKTDGTLWVWGEGFFGALGNNTSTTPYSSPIQTIAGGTNWKMITFGYNGGTTSGAVKTDGTLWMWGTASNGILGDNAIIRRSSPVQTIAGGTNWVCVSVGDGAAAAIKSDGTLWTWGTNSFGPLGDNSTINRSSPVQTVSGGTNWKCVDSGALSMFAVKTDGTYWAWGTNCNKVQLGNNGFPNGFYGRTDVNFSSPIQTAAGGTNWISASVSSGIRAP